PILFVSGQLPIVDGKPVHTGRVGSTVGLDDACAAARIAALNTIAQAAAVAGSLDALRGVVRVGGFVQADPEFVDVPKVVNGASDLFVELFGDAGRHARAAIGVASLPAGVPVEIEAVFTLESRVRAPRFHIAPITTLQVRSTSAGCGSRPAEPPEDRDTEWPDGRTRWRVPPSSASCGRTCSTATRRAPFARTATTRPRSRTSPRRSASASRRSTTT